MSQQEPRLTQRTLVSVSAVAVLMVAAMSYGILYQKVNGVDMRLTRVEEKIDQLNSTRLGLNQK